jgi:hypothetical protein
MICLLFVHTSLYEYNADAVRFLRTRHLYLGTTAEKAGASPRASETPRPHKRQRPWRDGGAPAFIFFLFYTTKSPKRQIHYTDSSHHINAYNTPLTTVIMGNVSTPMVFVFGPGNLPGLPRVPSSDSNHPLSCPWPWRRIPADNRKTREPRLR